MPIPSPFHERTRALCTSYQWKDWAGFYAVRAFGTYADREYFAIRHSAGLLDVTPLFKYEVYGPDATAFLAKVMVRNINKIKVGQVTYCCWCDDQGKLLDDGTVSRLDDTYYRVTAAEPNLHWFHRNARGYDVTIEDSTERYGALSLQGPNARVILKQITDADIDGLKFFRLTKAHMDGFEGVITRTGYTGDLGYELWVDNEHALALWDRVYEAGQPYGLQPIGLDALDLSRIEAGFIMNGVDYYSANHCMIELRKSTPYEAALGWTVNLKRDPFNGQAALRTEKKKGPVRKFVGLVYDWDEFEALFARIGLPPEVPGGAWRDSIPVYNEDGGQVGYATSGTWSPTLKKNLALATINAAHAKVGTVLRVEVTVEYVRYTIRATVTKKPFFDPPRKKE